MENAPFILAIVALIFGALILFRRELAGILLAVWFILYGVLGTFAGKLFGGGG